MIYTYNRPTNRHPAKFSSAVGQHDACSSSMDILSRLICSMDITRMDITSSRDFINREFISKQHRPLISGLYQGVQSYSDHRRIRDQNYFPQHNVSAGGSFHRSRDQNYFPVHSVSYSGGGFRKSRDKNYFLHFSVASGGGAYGCGAGYGYGENRIVNHCLQQPTGLNEPAVQLVSSSERLPPDMSDSRVDLQFTGELHTRKD